MSISPPPPLKLSALTLTAADAAKRSARNGTTRHTANARSATRVTQGAAGQATIAIGMPTNSKSVETLTAILSSSSPRNSRLAAIAIAMFKNVPIGVRFSAPAAPSPAASRRALSSVTVAEPSSAELARLARLTAVANSRPHRQHQRGSDRAGEALKCGEPEVAAAREPGRPVAGDGDRRHGAQEPAAHRANGRLKLGDVSLRESGTAASRSARR